jgi:GNAT superfamily N-acetyltransferase
MEFRQATSNDAASIALLHARSWQRAYRGMMPDEFLDGAVVPNRLAIWQARMHENRADRFTCLALNQDQVVGFICAFGDEDKSWGSYIDNLHIDLGYQRFGLGTELMCRTGRWLGEHYADVGVYLWVMDANLSARSFYERLGGHNRETMMKSDPGGGRAPNCRYTWNNPALLARGLTP